MSESCTTSRQYGQGETGRQFDPEMESRSGLDGCCGVGPGRVKGFCDASCDPSCARRTIIGGMSEIGPEEAANRRWARWNYRVRYLPVIGYVVGRTNENEIPAFHMHPENKTALCKVQTSSISIFIFQYQQYFYFASINKTHYNNSRFISPPGY